MEVEKLRKEVGSLQHDLKRAKDSEAAALHSKNAMQAELDSHRAQS